MEILRKLVEMSGVSGREERVRQFIIDEMKPLVDEIKTDQLGNVIGFKKAKGPMPKGGRKKIMVAAHMDEIGFVVSYIDDKGFIRMQPAGGFDPRTLMAQRVTVHGKKDLPGVIGSKPIHILTEEEKKKKLDIKDYFIDLGLPKERVDELVKVGDPITMYRKMVELGDCYSCKTFDDRVGVYCMLEALHKVKESPADIYAVATTQEEVGLRGAFASSSGIKPDIGIALDVTLANDVPGAKGQEEISHLGKGTSLCIMNGASITNPKLINRFAELAEEKKIPYQKDVMPRGGTDAGAIQKSEGGSAVITVSIPCRYVHSTVETVHKNDVQATTDLLAAYLEDPGDMDYVL
ncbi:MAG: M42 family metallopeptidase [Candidatus Hatepunaea meridiana]|nr:M42 family metallopeptidase [Candidatus Hatepunaea meridiana]